MMISAIFKALFAIGASVVLVLSMILFITLLWGEITLLWGEYHDDMGE